MALSISQAQNLTLHLLLEKTEDGRSRASVLELPDYVVEVSTDEEAIRRLQEMVDQRFAKIQVRAVDVSVQTERKNPWIEFIGMFEGDADFAEIAAELRLERGFDEMGLM